MADLKHTPGPWVANCSHIYAPDGAIIATVSNPGSKASDYPLVANRDLMAAAPEMYAALAGLIDEYEDYPEMTAARAALAKARGKS